MRFRGRPAIGRPHFLASALAALLVVLGSGIVLAGTTTAPATPPEPRVQRPGDVAGYRLPFQPGLDVYIHQGWNSPYSHNGRSAYAYDFGMRLNTPVLAAASGIVSYVHTGETACGGAALRNHANYVTIDHPDGSSTQYGHLGAVEVEVGDVVQVGQEIALSGRTGYTGCMPHLHFARQVQGGPVTQSIPVYFVEFPDDQLREGETIQTTPTCAGTEASTSKTDSTSKAETTTKGEATTKAKAPDAKAPAPPMGRFCATYRGSEAGSPILFSRLEKAIDFDWTKHAPGGYWLDDPANGFAATWTGRFEIETEGVYALAVLASGHVRIRIDGVTLVDAWRDYARPRDLSLAWRATTGTHVIEVEHFDTTGQGTLHVGWAPELLDGAWTRWSKAKPEA